MKRNVFLNEKVAKKLFKNEKYGKILSAKVISDILDEDYDLVYNNIKLSTDEISFSSKTLNSITDAIYYDDVRYFNIEINFYRNHNKERQLNSYTYQLYLGQLHTHKDYPKLKKIIQISIDSYDYFKHNEFMYYVSFMEEKYHEKENDDITKIHINLEYLQEMEYNNIEISGNKLMKDLYFLICEDKERLKDVYEGDSLMKEIIDEAKQIAGVMELDLYATDEELIKMDQEEYFQKGMKQGIEENQKQVIKNMLNDNVDIKTISKYTNLSINELQKIINKLN